ECRRERDHKHPDRRTREHRAWEAHPSVPKERPYEHPRDRDPPELLAGLDPVRVLQRERVHRDHHEIDREREPTAAEAQLLSIDRREKSLQDRTQPAAHAIAAVDSWKSSSMGAPAARCAAGTPATASSPRIARRRARSRSSRSNGGLTITAC